MNFGDQIKYYRKKAGLTQEQLAHKAQISRSYLADLEGHRYSPSLTTLQFLADALHLHIADFFLDQRSETIRITDQQLKKIIQKLISLDQNQLAQFEKALDLLIDPES